MNQNRVHIAGHLARDAEIRYGTTGTAISNMTVATTRKWKAKNGDQKEETAWVDCKAFGAIGEACGKFRKGDNVVIEGHLTTESWEEKETHARRSKLLVYIDSFPGLLVRPAKSEAAPARQEKPAPAADPAPADDSGDDSVPF